MHGNMKVKLILYVKSCFLLIAFFLCVSHKCYRIHTSRPRVRYKSWQDMSWWKTLHHQSTSHTRATDFVIYKIHYKNEYPCIIMKCISALPSSKCLLMNAFAVCCAREDLEEFGQIILSSRYSTHLKPFSSLGTSLNYKTFIASKWNFNPKRSVKKLIWKEQIIHI
jgi:hypothetical protein